MRIHATTAQSIRLPLTHLSGPHSARDLEPGQQRAAGRAWAALSRDCPCSRRSNYAVVVVAGLVW